MGMPTLRRHSSIPIMGAAAFLMSEYMGIPYRDVALKAILPAVLYFTGIYIIPAALLTKLLIMPTTTVTPMAMAAETCMVRAWVDTSTTSTTRGRSR